MVFTSDHETGGLALPVIETNLNLLPIWSTNGHTGVAVPLLATGPGADAFSGIHTNWQVGRKIAGMLLDEAPPEP